MDNVKFGAYVEKPIQREDISDLVTYYEKAGHLDNVLRFFRISKEEFETSLESVLIPSNVTVATVWEAMCFIDVMIKTNFITTEKKITVAIADALNITVVWNESKEVK